jgi:hypothetical protein
MSAHALQQRQYERGDTTVDDGASLSRRATVNVELVAG